MPELTYYLENADSSSAGSAAFQLTGGSSSAVLYLLGSTYGEGNDAIVPTSELPLAITQILGSVSTAAGDGRLQRNLPLSHPLFSWLFASSVSLRGVGQSYKADAANPLNEVQSLPFLTAYNNYEFHVSYSPRPYVVAADASVPVIQASFYPTTSSGEPASALVAAEWLRYTNWWYDRKFESITARQGQMKFRAPDGKPVNNVPYADMPKLFLPDLLLHVLWQQVPYRWVVSANSYVDNLLGFINQNAFTTWKPGELLYVGYNARPYTPPVQQLDNLYTGTTGFIYSAEKLVDVELLFLRTKRTLAKGESITPSNPNWINAGWNLLPWFQDRQFHYATTVGNPDTDDSQWRPMFLSAEFGLLFTDPDAPGAYSVADL